MVPHRLTDVPHSSFQRPVPLPPSTPDSDARLIVAVNSDWVPYILGALTQLYADWTWDTINFFDLVDVKQSVVVLFDLFMEAPFGPEYPIMFRVTADGTLEFSLDDGFSWADTGLDWPGETANLWTGNGQFVNNGVESPLIFNGGAGLPLLPDVGAGPMLAGVGGIPMFNQPNPNVPIAF